MYFELDSTQPTKMHQWSPLSQKIIILNSLHTYELIILCVNTFYMSTAEEEHCKEDTLA